MRFFGRIVGNSETYGNTVTEISSAMKNLAFQIRPSWAQFRRFQRLEGLSKINKFRSESCNASNREIARSCWRDVKAIKAS